MRMPWRLKRGNGKFSIICCADKSSAFLISASKTRDTLSVRASDAKAPGTSNPNVRSPLSFIRTFAISVDGIHAILTLDSNEIVHVILAKVGLVKESGATLGQLDSVDQIQNRQITIFAG